MPARSTTPRPSIHALTLMILISAASLFGCAEGTAARPSGDPDAASDTTTMDDFRPLDVFEPDAADSSMIPDADPDTSPPAGCGDGVVQAGEECDDGNASDDDACLSTCIAARCGDSQVHAGVEECDDGNAIDTDGCVSNCRLPGCGDSIVQPGEDCDDGNADDTDSCLSDCTMAACGDGVVQPGEACDDGNTNDGDGCTNDCALVSCGDGVLQEGEQCDDGNTDSNDGCLNTCLTARCGDNVLQVGVEECDDGNLSDTDACLSACLHARCGDGRLQEGVEQCDDNNLLDTDACLSTCVPASCGDGFVQTGVESCDDGNTVDTDSCSNSCSAAGCGDGVVQAGEQCDDGAGNSNGGSCLLTCVFATCGDGFTETGVEDCDDGNALNDDACLSTCEFASCGDGFVRPGFEQCDDGNSSDNDACTNACTNAQCGDGLVYNGVEECDDGNSNNTDSCLTTCVAASCGDGIVQLGEQCDDGNASNNDACISCSSAICGDGFLRSGVEQCDDGNTTNGDGCDSGCNTEVVSFCGDGIVDAGEQCDDGNNTNGDGCDASCMNEVVQACGDGIVQSGEECDDGNTTSGDGCDSGCFIEGCNASVSLLCDARYDGNTAGATATNVFVNWDACSIYSYTGPEVVHAFTALNSGPIEAILTFDPGVMDLDLMVLADTGAGCDPIGGACEGGSFNFGATASVERVDWIATAGTTYYIVVETFGAGSGPYLLTLGGSEKHLFLNEIGGAGSADEFVEIINTSICDVDLDPYELRFEGDATSLNTVTVNIPASTIIPGNDGIIRFVEGTADFPNERSMSAEGGINGILNVGHATFCRGACNLTTCENVFDYMEFDNDTADGFNPSRPACVNFQPAPVNTNGVGSNSINRTTFSGSNPTWQQGDWALGPATRN